MDAKQKLRQQLFVERNKLSVREQETLTASICSHLTHFFADKKGNVLGYQALPARREADLKELYQWLDWHGFELDLAGSTADASFPVKQYDFILMPMLGFDDDKHRLGFGGGWYDRFLVGQPNAVKIGVAYNVGHTESFQFEEHDIPMDMVITESGVFVATKTPG